MRNEIWAKIDGYGDSYYVSNLGRVYSRKTKKFLKSRESHHGYQRITLYKNGIPTKYQLHRLVAFAFLPNPTNLSEVNHKDENPKNNMASNLEWCDRKRNVTYGNRIAKRSKPVFQMTASGEIIAAFPSTSEASRKTGIRQGSISNCCVGRTKSAGGYTWSFKPSITIN